MILQCSEKEQILVHSPESCIACGHCVSVCPKHCIDHESFPPSTLHPIDYGRYPSPESMIELIRARRSNRTFTSKPIPKESLDWIVEAAYRAPTATNAQEVGFTLVTDPAKLKLITDSTIAVFDKLVNLLTHPLVKPILKRIMPDPYRYEEAFKEMKQENENGNDLILRGATAVMLFHAPKSSRFGCEDCNLAYQNASLMAESLGVSQFYTGFVLTAIKQGNKALLKGLGIEETVWAGIALGLPQFRYPNYVDREPIKISMV